MHTEIAAIIPMQSVPSRRKKPKNMESNELTPKPTLKSLLVPWLSIASIAIMATLITIHHQSSLVPSFTRIMSDNQEYYKEYKAYNEQHKALYPFNSTDYRGFLCAILGLMVAAGGGIGGGGILVPIYILVMGFSPKHAIPLSNITVFGGACANTYLNTKKRHPLAERPMVDWDLILIMEPLTIAGALCGAFLNKVLREEVLAVMLVLLLSFTAYNTLKKAMKMYKVESVHLKEQSSSSYIKESELTTIAAEDDVEDDVKQEELLLDNPLGVDEGERGGDYESMGQIDLTDNAVLAKLLEEEKSVPRGNITLLIVMFVVVLFVNIVKGGGAFSSPLGIECGSISFWIANCIMLGWIFMISLMARSYLLNRYQLKESCGYQ